MLLKLYFTQSFFFLDILKLRKTQDYPFPPTKRLKPLIKTLKPRLDHK